MADLRAADGDRIDAGLDFAAYAIKAHIELAEMLDKARAMRRRAAVHELVPRSQELAGTVDSMTKSACHALGAVRNTPRAMFRAQLLRLTAHSRSMAADIQVLADNS